MKTLKQILTFAMVLMLAVACKNNAQPEVKTVETEVKADTKELDPNAKYAKAEFTVKGMTCAIGCAKTIEKKLANMEGVKSAKVDFDKELAMVEFDEAKVTPNDLEATVKKAGETYSVEDMKTVEDFDTSTTKKEDSENVEQSAHKVSCNANCKKSNCKMSGCSKSSKA